MSRTLPSTILIWMVKISRILGQCAGIDKELFDSPILQLSCTNEQVAPNKAVPRDTTCVIRWLIPIFLYLAKID